MARTRNENRSGQRVATLAVLAGLAGLVYLWAVRPPEIGGPERTVVVVPVGPVEVSR
jgi:ABC-type transporter Mla subunit MlaD